MKKFLTGFLSTHAGKATAGVVLGDGLIAWPDLLSFLVAGYLLYWAIGHLRQAFRSLDAEAALQPAGDALDVAAALDIATRDKDPVPALIVPGGPAVAVPPAVQETLPDWLRQLA
jgi:hypothetical protein